MNTHDDFGGQAPGALLVEDAADAGGHTPRDAQSGTAPGDPSERRGQVGGDAQSRDAAPAGGKKAPGTKSRRRGQAGAALQSTCAPSGGGHTRPDVHSSNAPTDPIAGHAVSDTQSVSAGSQDGGHALYDTHVAGAPILADLRVEHRLRVDFHREEKSLTLRMKAICRRFVGGDKVEGTALYNAAMGSGEHPLAAAALSAISPFVTARDIVESARKEREKHMRRMAKKLPCVDWWCDQRGLAVDGFAAVMAECGDLLRYDNPAKVWKRMGLAVIGGGRQRMVKGDAALDHGYNPERRAIMWNIGEAMVKTRGTYADVWLDRIRTEIAKAEAEGLIVATTTKVTVESWEKRGLPAPAKVSKLDPAKHRGCGHIHNRAKRYMEKRILRDLWRAWRRAAKVWVNPDIVLPPEGEGLEATLEAMPTREMPPAPLPEAAE